MHGIHNNGKTAYCSCDDIGIDSCHSIYRVSFGMEPNSGIYEIRMKIDEISSCNRWSAIGTTTDTNCNELILDYSTYWGFSDGCIGWSSFNKKDFSAAVDTSAITFSNMKNGLFLGSRGWGTNTQENIFIKSKFMYKSNNEYYKNELPYIKTGDRIIMKYDSNNNVLSFFKSNDVKLNAQISNLPKDQILYWFVGRFSQQLSVTIV